MAFAPTPPSRYDSQPATARFDGPPPKPRCFACRDTGILQNSDALINTWPDYAGYDRDPNGRPCSGLHLALVCTCEAAYPVIGPDGKPERGGFRESSGSIRQVESDAGPRWVGIEPPDGLIAYLSEHRQRAWQRDAALGPAQRREQIAMNLAMLREQLNLNPIGDCPQPAQIATATQPRR